MEDERKTFSTKEVADIVGVHKNTILNWIRDGKIPDARRDWKSYRIWTQRDLDRLIEFKNRYHQLDLDIA